MGWILFLIIPLVMPIMLIRRGLRGVAIDNHPLCRRCGFDLFGRPPASNLCGECGGDLSRQTAIVIGHRQKRWAALGFGIFALTLSSVGLGIEVYGRMKQVNWWHHAPLIYVLREARSSDATWRSPAIAELAHRCESNSLPPNQRNEILDAGLAYQGDLSKPWDTAWGDLLEDANDAHQLSSERRRRYARQAINVPITAWVDPEIFGDQPLGWHVRIPAARIAYYSNLSVWCSYGPPRWLDLPLKPGEFGPPGGGGGFGTCSAWDGGTKNRHGVSHPRNDDDVASPGRPLLIGTHQVEIPFTWYCQWSNSQSDPELIDTKSFILPFAVVAPTKH